MRLFWPLFIILVALLVLLQYQLWWGTGGRTQLKAIQVQIEQQNIKIAEMLERNERLQAEIISLKTDLQAVEAKARYELGLIKEGESFVQILPSQSN